MSAESMHQVVSAEGPNKGQTPFYCLASTPEGQQLIGDKWDYFVKNELISTVSMELVVTKDGAFKGQKIRDVLRSISQGRSATTKSVATMIGVHGLFVVAEAPVEDTHHQASMMPSQ